MTIQKKGEKKIPKWKKTWHKLYDSKGNWIGMEIKEIMTLKEYVKRFRDKYK